MASWWDGLKSLFDSGRIDKRLEDMSNKELEEIRRELNLGLQKLDRRLDRNDQEQRAAAQAVLAAGSQARKIVAMERLNSVKRIGKTIASALIVRNRYVLGIESIITLRESLGDQASPVLQKVAQMADPSAVGEYLRTMQDELNEQHYDTNQIIGTLDDMANDVSGMTSPDQIADLERMQDDMLDDPNLTEEEKIRRLLEE